MAGDTIKFLIEMRDSASGPLKKVGKAADQSAKDAKTATTKYTELSSKLHLLGVAAKAAQTAVLAVAKPMKMLAKGGIEAGAQMEGFETRLKVLMGSSAAARDRLDELFKIGSTTPFELPGLMEAEVNLRALGVNAEETLPLVMDFAGAMGVDVARAAVEVGRAMQFGAGAVETIAGRALRAQVELRTGADALKMSTGEFREAMVETLTDPDGIFKGGTDKLAATFDGMLSNLQDAWFKFKKEIGEADLFLTAKATLKTVLDLLDQNRKSVSSLASEIGGKLAAGILAMVDGLSKFVFFILRGQEGFTVMNQIIKMLAISMTEMFRDMLRSLETLPIMGPALKTAIGGAIEASTGELRRMNKELQESTVKVDDLRSKQLAALKMGADAVENIQTLRTKFAEAPHDGGGGGGVPAPQAPQAGDTEADKGPTAQELEEALSASLTSIEQPLKDARESLLDLQYKLSPAGLAEGFVNKISDPMKTMTAALGPAGGLVSGLSAIGQMGSKAIVDGMKEAIRGVITALVEVVPDLIVEIPRMLIHLVPELIEGLIMAAPAIIKALVFELPVAFANGLMKWWRKIWETIKSLFPGAKKREAQRKAGREMGGVQGALVAGGGNVGATVGEALRMLFRGKKQTGAAHIDRTGLALVHAGEAIIPSNGANAQSVAGRMGRGGGVNVQISTNVVDPNSIRALGRMLEREFGSFGRSTSPVFNSPTGTSG